jgi:hypothetical protein
MQLPQITFKEFLKNPIIALLFMSLMAVGYLYFDNKTTLTNQITGLQKEIKVLKKDYKELNDKFIDVISKIKDNE